MHMYECTTDTVIQNELQIFVFYNFARQLRCTYIRAGVVR